MQPRPRGKNTRPMSQPIQCNAMHAHVCSGVRFGRASLIFLASAMFPLCSQPTTASPAEAACESIDSTCRQDLLKVKFSCFQAHSVSGELADVDDLGRPKPQNATACQPPSKKSVTKLQKLACTRCIAKTFGDNYDGCSCCILPLLQQAGLNIDDIKALDEYFPDTNCPK